MKLNTKTTAFIHSLNSTSVITIEEQIGNNQYIADYRGVKCVAMYNPFSGMYYADDIFGVLPYMSEDKWERAVEEMRYLAESNERELEAYRRLGSITELKALKLEEKRRNKTIRKFHDRLLNIFLCSCALFSIWVIIYFIAINV